MALLNIHYFLAIVYLSLYGIRASTEEAEIKRSIELEQRLKLINKPAIKSIEVDYAMFDCVDIYSQPAFDHPLLKNHKIQMKPANWHDMSNKVDNGHSTQKITSTTFGQHLNCPNGTVPIYRTTKKDLIKEKFLRGVGAYNFTNGNSNVHFAVLDIKQDKEYKITGAKGNIDIQNPQCNKGEASGAMIWLFTQTRRGKVIDGISVGWMVDSRVYGNASTYFEASWIGKGRRGCINLRCPGFVQVSQSHPLGLVLTNISKYGGPLYTLPIWVYQDNGTKNWWLVSGSEKVGYWPRELFSTFDEGAQRLTYGGYVKQIPKQPISPPMGSGYAEECNYNHTSFFCKLEYQTTDQALKGMYIPPKTGETTKLRNGCPNYGVRYSCKDSQELGYYFLYGGPRGNCPS